MHLVHPSARVVGLGMTLKVRFLRNGTGMLPLGGTLRSALPWCHQRPALAHPSSSPGAGVGFVLTPHLHTLCITCWVYLLIITQKKLEGAPCDPLTGARVAGADGAEVVASRKPQDNVLWEEANCKLGYSVSRKLKGLIL